MAKSNGENVVVGKVIAAVLLVVFFVLAVSLMVLGLSVPKCARAMQTTGVTEAYVATVAQRQDPPLSSESANDGNAMSARVQAIDTIRKHAQVMQLGYECVLNTRARALWLGLGSGIFWTLAISGTVAFIQWSATQPITK